MSLIYLHFCCYSSFTWLIVWITYSTVFEKKNQMVLKVFEMLIKVVSLPSVFHILTYNLIMHSVALISVGSFMVEKVEL